jgi:predicted transcriptional regulator
MSKPTITDLTERMDKLVVHVQKMTKVIQQQAAHIEHLQDRDTKVRKQLWYLQKVAKGEFAIGKPKADSAIEADDVEDDSVTLSDFNEQAF